MKSPPKIRYAKGPKTFTEQIKLLKDRGLIIRNENKAIKILTFVSYNRLSNYWYPLLDEPKEEEIFKKGSTFEAAFRLYQFDSELRSLTFKALEQIEIGVRTQIIYHLSHKYNSGFWFENADAFKHYPAFVQLLDKICTNTSSTKQEFIRKYSQKYIQFVPPSWKAFELLTFNSMLFILKSIADYKTIIPISKSFGLPHSIFISWVQTLVYVRNICAHHSRLWNIKLTIKPEWLKSPLKPWVKEWRNDHAGTAELNDKGLKFYPALCIIIYCLDHVNPHNTYAKDVVELLYKYKEVDPIHMGFPENWEQENLWKKAVKKVKNSK